MDAVKFLKTKNMMCEEARGCDVCPLSNDTLGCQAGASVNQQNTEEELVDIVEQWAKENTKTRRGKMEEIIINGEKYVPANEMVEQLDGMDYCIVRTYSAGVFAAYVEYRDGKEAVLRQARRLWYWDGANSLSDIANKGVTKPENCKFTAPVDKEVVTEVIEILYVTKEAKASIEGVEEWTIK